MSNYEIDIFSSGKENSIRNFGDAIRETVSWLPANNVLLEKTLFPTYEAPDYNFIVNTVDVNNISDASVGLITRSMKLRIECAEGRRGFFLKIPNTVKIRYVDKPIKSDSIILCCAHQNGATYPIDCPDYPSNNNTRTTYYDTTRPEPTYTDYLSTRTRSARLFVLNPTNLHEYVYEKLTGDSVAGDVNNHNLTAEEKTDVYNKLLAILNGITYTLSENTLDVQEFRSYHDGNMFNINDFGMVMNEANQLQTYDMLPLPIFDYTQTEDILKYINTGDKSGALDVFDNENPKAKHIEDWKTNMQVFVSPEESDKKKTHLTIVAYNNDLINNFDTIEDDVRLHTVVQGATAGGQAFFAPMGKYPTQNLIVSNFPVNGLELYSALYQDNPYTHSDYFGVHLKPKDNSAVHCYVDFVTHSDDYPQTTRQTFIVKTQIVDGYRYTNTNTGEWVEVIFRAITLDDLKDYKYKNPEDNEDDQSGTDGTFTTGGGLRTYSITKEMFNTINNSLWSTDWTSVFKSTTVNPISCVIACKAIPFTAPTSGTDTVMIANMNSGVTASYVTPVKSFHVGSVNIPAYAGDFTDITLTHIRCYLPYIGWVELPASECIERVAYPTVGIEARHKHLSFKYIVDFVDGAVRCVVSVNGTERWYFDGNCSIDVPVTSDNHTQAVSNAIRSGVQTGLSIVTAVAGAYAGNAGAVAGGVMGAMQSAPNIFPTYSFTATSNGSGYINASMNQHIMLVIEHPNVIRSADYAKRVGVPCGLSLNLGSLHGYTRCVDVNVTGIDATPNEIQRIKSLLESGVYL